MFNVTTKLDINMEQKLFSQFDKITSLFQINTEISTNIGFTLSTFSLIILIFLLRKSIELLTF